MKKTLSILTGLALFLPLIASATPTSWDFANSILQPLQSMWTAQIKGSYFTATSTTNHSTFPYASSTALSATTVCLTGDTCRTTWPSGGSPGGSDTQVQFNNSGSFGGNGQFLFDKSNIILTLGRENFESAIAAPDATTTNSNGGALVIYTGLGNGSGLGGAIDIDSGQGGATGDGGLITIAGGPGGITSGNGGNVDITGGDVEGASGIGGNINITPGSPGDNGTRGVVNIPADNVYIGETASNASLLTLHAGYLDPTAIVSAWELRIIAGDGDTGVSKTKNGGALGLYGGNTTTADGVGGSIGLTAGFGTGAGAGGGVDLVGGDGGTTGAGGDATLTGGNGGGTSGNAGGVFLSGGTASGSGTDGNVYIGGAIATNADGGWMRIPNMAGIPTGTPLEVAMTVFDYTNSDLYIYGLSGWRKIGGSSLTGSGSANQIAYWSGTGGLTGSSNLQWDNINKNLGLSTSTMNASVTILSGGSLDLDAGGNGKGFQAFGSNATTSATTGGYADLIGGTGSTTGAGGTVTLEGGSGGTGTSNGGDVIFEGGTAHNGGTVGHVKIFDPISTITARFDTSLLASSEKTFTFPNQTGNFTVSSTTSLFGGIIQATTTSTVSGALTAGVCDTTTSTVIGANMSSTTAVETTPQTYPGDGAVWYSYVANTTQVVTKLCGLSVITPTATKFNLVIFQ